MELSMYLSSKKMKPSEFAALVGTSRQNVGRWCSGVTPRRGDMLKILAATEGKVTPNDFVLSAVAKPSEGRAA